MGYNVYSRAGSAGSQAYSKFPIIVSSFLLSPPQKIDHEVYNFPKVTFPESEHLKL